MLQSAKRVAMAIVPALLALLAVLSEPFLTEWAKGNEGVLPLIMFWVFALADLFRRYDISGWAKAAWLFAIVFLPFLGTIFYVLTRYPRW